MPSAVGHDEGDLALLAYARREIDAVSALARVCKALPATRCVLVAEERSGQGVIAGQADAANGEILCKAVALASSRRLLLTHAAGELASLGLTNGDVDWIVVEPIATRSGTYFASLAAMGARAQREEALRALPRAGLLCGEIAFESLMQQALARRMHRFNNLLAVLTANVENAASVITTSSEVIPPEQTKELVLFARRATQDVNSLVEAAADLSTTLRLTRSKL